MRYREAGSVRTLKVDWAPLKYAKLLCMSTARDLHRLKSQSVPG